MSEEISKKLVKLTKFTFNVFELNAMAIISILEYNTLLINDTFNVK